MYLQKEVFSLVEWSQDGRGGQPTSGGWSWVTHLSGRAEKCQPGSLTREREQVQMHMHAHICTNRTVTETKNHSLDYSRESTVGQP